MEEKVLKLSVQEIREKAPFLHAGDRIMLSGTIYTARDAAHARMFSLLLSFLMEHCVLFVWLLCCFSLKS